MVGNLTMNFDYRQNSVHNFPHSTTEMKFSVAAGKDMKVRSLNFHYAVLPAFGILNDALRHSEFAVTPFLKRFVSNNKLNGSFRQMIDTQVIDIEMSITLFATRYSC